MKVGRAVPAASADEVSGVAYFSLKSGQRGGWDSQSVIPVGEPESGLILAELIQRVVVWFGALSDEHGYLVVVICKVWRLKSEIKWLL